MKLDMGNAWSEATAMISANRELVAIIAGIFVFLPTIVLAVIAPEAATGPTEVNQNDPMATMQAFYAQNGIWLFVIAIINAIGSLALFALFADNRPTVGDAITTGIKTLLPYLAAQILLILALSILLGIPVGLAVAAGGSAAGVLVGIVAFVALVYVMIKFSLLAPAMIIGGILNPVRALRASWNATKGNSLRLLLFYFLLGIAVVVVAMVFGLVTGLFVAMLGTGAVAAMLGGALNGLVSAVWAVVIVAVLSATYRQLTGPSTQSVTETFE
ncbi:MAG: hypothetical protein WBH10_07280 [Allopontixanthobacter sediminis]